MNKDLRTLLIAAFENKPSANFSAEDVNGAAVNALAAELGLTEKASVRDIREVEAKAFALIEESIDEILPKKLESVLGEFAEIKSFPRDAEIVFNIEKVGKNRAKLTISKGARGGIYRAARLDSKYFSLAGKVYTVSAYVTLEEILLGTMSLSELFNNLLEGFEEVVYKEVFEALAKGGAAMGVEHRTTTTTSALGTALDSVLPVVKQYGIPTIFGSYAAVSKIYNPLASQGYPNIEDSADIRKYGHVQVYKGTKVVELPNYIVVDNSNVSDIEWAYSQKYVFVLPSSAKPVKVGLRGEMYIQKNTQSVGSEKWEAHKYMGVGIAMANNYAVIEVTDIED